MTTPTIEQSFQGVASYYPQYIGGEIWGRPVQSVWVNNYSYTDGKANHIRAINRPSFTADNGVTHGGVHKIAHDKNVAGYHTTGSTSYDDWYVPSVDEIQLVRTFLANNPSHALHTNINSSSYNLTTLWSSTVRGSYKAIVVGWKGHGFGNTEELAREMSSRYQLKWGGTYQPIMCRLCRRVS